MAHNAHHGNAASNDDVLLQCGIDPDNASSNENQDESPRSNPRFIEINDFLKRPPSANWIVRNYISADTLMVFFGEPSSGKSLVLIDIACHIATGRSWCENAVKPGLVLYICGEGQHGLSKRFMAWFQRYQETPRNIHLATIPTALTSPDDIQALIADIVSTLPAKPVLILLDTLNRNFGPGDENSTSDMTKAVSALDKIREATGAAIGVAHHCGKADKTNGRGSSVLKGAADVEYLIDKDMDTSIVSMRYAKPPKDFDPPPAVAWTITKQETPWADEEAQPINSVILEPIDVPLKSGSKTPLGDNQRRALDILKRLFKGQQDNLTAGGINETPRVAVRDWFQAMNDDGIPKNRRSEAKASLLQHGLIKVDEGGYVYPA